MRGVCAVVGAVLGAIPVAAQDADPIQVLKDAAAAMKQVTALEFNATAEGVGALAARSPRLNAAVRARRIDGDDQLGWKIGLDGRMFNPGADAEVRYAASYDGKVFRSLREADQVVAEAQAAHAKALLEDGAGWVIGWLVRWDELVSDLYAVEEPVAIARYDGVTDVAGVRCHVVYADYSELSDPTLYGAWWFIAESDSLPRRVEMHYLDDELGNGFARVTLDAVNAGGAIDSDAFALAAPDGFTTEQYQPPAADAAARPARPPPPPVAAVGAQAPDFTLKDPAGKVHRLADYRGKVVVLDFWATWCGPCRMAMPSIQKLHDKFKGRGVAVFGINAWENADPAAYMKQNGFTYGLLLDGDDAASAYGVTGIPTFVVIGTDGKILHQASGFDPQGDKVLEKVIEDHLQRGGS